MTIIPIDIKTKEFTKSFRGFDIIEVRSYLDKLSLEVDELLSDNENLQVEAAELKLKLADFNTIKKELNNLRSNLNQDEKDQVKPDLKDSTEIIREAELKAAKIVERAKESANEIRDAVLTLREQKDLIIAKLKAMVETQAGLFESKSGQFTNEKEITSKLQPNENIDVDVDDIVNKIL